jgi:hypothetical protein
VLYVVTNSVDARPKNVPLLLHDAVACLSAPQTGHCHFVGRRAATSTGPPALCAPRVTRTTAGCPAARHAARYQLVPRAVKPILGLRAVQLAHRFDILPPRLPQPARFCAVASLYLFRKAFISVENLCHPIYDNTSVRLLMYEWHWAHLLLDRSWLFTCTASLVRVYESSFFVLLKLPVHLRVPILMDTPHPYLSAPTMRLRSPSPDGFPDPPTLDHLSRMVDNAGEYNTVMSALRKTTERMMKAPKSCDIGKGHLQLRSLEILI